MKGGLAVSLVRNMLKFAALLFVTGLACSLGGPTAPATALPTATFTQTETPTITLTASGTFTDVPAGNVAATVAIATNVTAATPTLFNAASGSTGGSTGGVPPTRFVAVSQQCILTMTEPTLAYRHPDMTQVFGTLAAGESVEATARNVLGWYGFDPGIAQAGNVGLDRLRWLPAGTAAGHSIKASAGCATLTIVSYPEN